MRPNLRVALVGYGLAGQVFHAPLIAAVAGLQLHTVVSSAPSRVHADHPGVRVVAEPAMALADPDIDVVVIAAPNAVHAPLALAALAQGKHVVVDKPFAVDQAQARAVAEAALSAQRLVSVFHNRRWDSDFLTVRQLIANGRLGEVAEFHSHFDRFRPVVADRWREHDAPGAGLWFDLGPHLLDQALQLFGTPHAVYADITMQRQGARVDDYFNVLLRYDRLRVILHGGSLVTASTLRLAVHGTRGSFIKHGMDGQEAALREGVIPGSPGWGADPLPGLLHVLEEGVLSEEHVAVVPGDYLAYYRGLHAAIVDGAPPPVSPDDALSVMSLLECAAESSRQRREIEFS